MFKHSSILFNKSNCPKERQLAKQSAGCFLNWKPGLSDDGETYNDSHYIWFLAFLKIEEAWGFSEEECDKAWQDFLYRHRGSYPNGNWREKEKEYLDSLGKDKHAGDSLDYKDWEKKVTCRKCAAPLSDNQLVKDLYKVNSTVSWAKNRLKTLADMLEDRNHEWFAQELRDVEKTLKTL